MLTLPQIDEIQGRLDRLPDLVNEYEASRSDFEGRVRAWLAELEDCLVRHQVRAASEVAMLRLELATAGRRRPVPSGGAAGTVTTRSRRSDRMATVVEIVGRAHGVVRDALAPATAMMAEGESIARQIAAIARTKGHEAPASAEWDEAVAAWDRVRAEPELLSATTHLLGLVGRVNAVLLYVRGHAAV